MCIDISFLHRNTYIIKLLIIIQNILNIFFGFFVRFNSLDFKIQTIKLINKGRKDYILMY